MHKKKSIQWLLVSLFLVSAHGSFANTKLADVMGNISDQLTELNTFSKLVPKDANARAFAKAQSRSRLVQFLFGVLDEKKGTVDAAGALVAAELTPDKFATLSGKELEDFVAEYSKTVTDVAALFGKVETELATQLAVADPAARDFTALKANLADISTAMRNAHRVFR